jgi:glycosyltransferase involved in cell wall biosynthesis
VYRDKSVAVVVPAYNEETQIMGVLSTIPPFVDWVVVVDDHSSDRTSELVRLQAMQDPRIVLLQHATNQGVGGAIATGYKWARDRGTDCAAVMAGDGQMDPSNLPMLLDPVVAGETDYAKGNRLVTGEAYRTIPRTRYLGNAALSLLTKIVSGYWHIADSQSGYTVISRHALEAIDWDRMYRRYGQPNDLLVRLNVENMRVRDVPVRPVYRVGERSGIRYHRVIFTISWLLFKLFWWRMKEKYVIRDFHPLVFFYLLAFLLMMLSAGFTGHVLVLWHRLGHAPELSTLGALFMFATGMQSLFFAMWFDMEANKDLR